MTIYALLGIIFLITVLILVIVTISAITSARNENLNAVTKQRDALDKLTRDTQSIDADIQQMTDDELRKNASGRW